MWLPPHHLLYMCLKPIPCFIVTGVSKAQHSVRKLRKRSGGSRSIRKTPRRIAANALPTGGLSRNIRELFRKADMGRQNAEAALQLPPGFRFFPTDEELLVHYLCRRAASQSLPVPIIAEVDLYKYDPWQLPEKALFGEKEWYFFTPRDRKYPNGSRPNRAAGSGYWKATGADKPITTGGGSKRVGIKKALVFYAGKAPKGTKSNWIMHEYRLADANRTSRKKGSLRLDDWVLCRIYNKKSSAEKIEREHKESSLDEAMESFEAGDEQEMQNVPTLNSAMNSIRQSIPEHPEPSLDHLNRLNPSPPNCNVISHDDVAVKCEIDSQNPVFPENTSTFNFGILPISIAAPAFNPMSSFAHQWTNHTSGDTNSELRTDSCSSKPSSSDPISEKEEVQSSFRLKNFLEEDHQSLFNFGLEGLQNPFLQFDQMPSSNPYEEYIAGLAASEYLPRFYQTDMLLN